MRRPVAFLAIDLEDYRRQELRDHSSRDEPAHPGEVERQLDRTLELLGLLGVRATFFSVGRLASELAPGAWRELADRHRLGCHGHEHMRVRSLGAGGFERDLRAAKAALEDAAGQPVISYRAPYFSSDGCDPWYGEILARAGFVIDSSRRLRRPPSGFTGTVPLAGSGGAVWEVPLPSLGAGQKRLTVIGGTYFRLLPLAWIIALLEDARARGFIATVYLHPYDLDPAAPPLNYGRSRIRHWGPRLGDRIRRLGRTSTAEKLRCLARIYDFRPIESILWPDPVMPPDGPGAVAGYQLASEAGAAQVLRIGSPHDGTLPTE